MYLLTDSPIYKSIGQMVMAYPNVIDYVMRIPSIQRERFPNQGNDVDVARSLVVLQCHSQG